MKDKGIDIPDKEPKPKTPKIQSDPNIWTGNDKANQVYGDAPNKDYREYYGLGGNDKISGGPGNNLIDGGDGDDILFGGGGVNTLLGGKGNDLLYGGYGQNTNNILTGGSGADSFYLQSDAEGAVNKITDFNAAEGDKVYVEISTFYKSGGQAQNSFSTSDFSYNQSSGTLIFDNPFDGLPASVVCTLQPNLWNGFVPARDVIVAYPIG
jgi:Ca2+-binding RTX toxin-like protein